MSVRHVVAGAIVFWATLAQTCVAASQNIIRISVASEANTPRIVHPIYLPTRIPASCVLSAAQRYDIAPMAILAVLKQESGGRTGVVSKNKNGSKDYGPAQFNDQSWGKYMREKYGISLASLTHNMCQAIMAQAYALRYEWNRCIKKSRPTIWCAIANYHSPTKKYQDIYVRNVWKQHQQILAKGKF